MGLIQFERGSADRIDVGDWQKPTVLPVSNDTPFLILSEKNNGDIWTALFWQTIVDL